MTEFVRSQRTLKMWNIYFIITITLFLKALLVEAGDFCQYGTSSYYFYTYYTTYCDYGCCGDKYSSYNNVCCVQNLDGIIAGSVIGGLVGLAILIGLIVFCCVAANKSGRSVGTVVQPANNTQAIMVNNTVGMQGPSTNPGPYGPVGYGYQGGVAPPAYAPFNNVPTGGANMAYPPPPLAKY